MLPCETLLFAQYCTHESLYETSCLLDYGPYIRSETQNQPQGRYSLMWGKPPEEKKKKTLSKIGIFGSFLLTQARQVRPEIASDILYYIVFNINMLETLK